MHSPVKENYRVICDYLRKDSTELSLKVGDVVEVFKKGKYLWFGQVHDAKGFFPSKVVEAEDQSSNKEIENPLSSTAATDSEKKSVIDGAVHSEVAITSSKSEKPFNEIGSTKLLEDKRRSKPKSPGRPPSQVFLKENILQRSESTEDLDYESTDEENNEPEVTSSISTKITTVSQLVMELKQKPNLKAAIQKDVIVIAGAGGSDTTTVEQVAEAPGKKQPVMKKKLHAPEPPKKPENAKTVPPWIEEIRKRREHKLSLKGDEDVLQKVSQESRTIQENKINHSSVETKSFGKSWTTNSAISSETRNIRTNSVSSETREVSSNISMTATEINISRTSSSVENSLDQPMTPVVVHDITNNIRKNELPVETDTTPKISTTSNDLATNVVHSQSFTTYASTNLCSTEHSKDIKDAKDTLGKIETPQEVQVSVTISATSNKAAPSSSKQTSEFVEKTQPEQPKSLIAAENQATLNAENQKDISKEEQPSLSLPQSSNKEQIVNSLQSVLNLVDTFEAQRTVRSLEILDDIKKVEASFNLQNQETKIFIEAMKAKVSALIKEKH